MKQAKESIVQFEGELDLTRWSRGFADDPEAAAADDVGGQAEVDFVEDIKELRANLKDREFSISAMAESGVLDQGEVKIAKAGGAKCAAAKGAEAAVVRTAATGNIDGDLEP